MSRAAVITHNALNRRTGLYIVDLENTRATPRFLAQGGTWEVADVQWKFVEIWLYLVRVHNLLTSYSSQPALTLQAESLSFQHRTRN